MFGVLRECPHTPLYSEFYNEHDLQFSVIIVDESQLAKNETTLLSMAIRPLEYGVALLLTGTPVFNTWRDLVDQLMLLPEGGREEGAFENLDHLTELIRLGRPAREGEEEMVLVDGPGGHHRLLLNNLLAALAIARPKP